MQNNDQCDRVVFNTSYSFNNLTNCENRGGPGSGYAINVSITSDMLMYTGNVYVNILVPIDLTQELWGYSKFRYVYPFEFGFKKRMSALVGVPTEQDLRVFIRSAELSQTSVLTLILETQYPRPEGLKMPTIIPSGRIVLSQSADPCVGLTQLCIQEWHYTASSWVEADNILYEFGWQAINDSHPMSVDVLIQETLQQVQSETGLEIGTLQLRVFKSQSDLVIGQDLVNNDFNFDPRDVVYIRADAVVPTEDQQNFGLQIINAYLCYSNIEGYQIEYSETGKQGCLDPFILPSERFQLIIETAVNTAAEVADFDTDLLGSITQYLNPTGPSDAFSFIANPQQQIDRIYTVHLECEISQRPPTKRSTDDVVGDAYGPRIRYITTISTQEYVRSVEFTTQSHTIRSERQSTPVGTTTIRSLSLHTAQPASSLAAAGLNLGIGLGVCLALVGVIALALRRRRRPSVYSILDSEADAENANSRVLN